MNSCTPFDVGFPFADEVVWREGLEYIRRNIRVIDPSFPLDVTFELERSGHAHNPEGMLMLLAFENGLASEAWDPIASLELIQKWIDDHSPDELIKLFRPDSA